MLYAILLSLLFVGSQATTATCPAGEEDLNDTDDVAHCAACLAGTFKTPADNTKCGAKVAKVESDCKTLNRALDAAKTSATIDDSACAEACNEGFKVATGADAATAACDECLTGFWGPTCIATTKCESGSRTTNFESVATATADAVCKPCADTEHTTDKGVTCVPNSEECTDQKATPFAEIAATITSDKICGCIGGRYGALCAKTCEDGKFLVAGDNQGTTDVATACTAWTVCKIDGKLNAAETAEYGLKTKGTTGTDNECNAASSAAALVIPAFALIAMLF